MIAGPCPGPVAGFPAAWCVTSDEKQESIAQLLLGLLVLCHKHHPGWKPSCFVVDCCDALINALRFVVASNCHQLSLDVINCRLCREYFPDVRILLCNYHVRNAWLKNLVEKVKDYDLRMAMFADPNAIQELRDLERRGKEYMDQLVSSAVEAFVKKYETLAPAFVAYFLAEWVRSGKMGALVFVPPSLLSWPAAKPVSGCRDAGLRLQGRL
jgi:hypothetical protein